MDSQRAGCSVSGHARSDAFPGSEYQAYIHTSKYARWLRGARRRETWPETVTRYFDFMERHLRDHHGVAVPSAERAALEGAVLRLEVMPSMRALMTAGPALEVSNIAAYNCSFMPVDHPDAFHEALFVLMHGTGVGFSVERQFTEQLPLVPERIAEGAAAGADIYVGDSREGWAEAVRQLVYALFAGRAPLLDTRDVRPEGAPLATFGGLASGPAPLHALRDALVATFRGAAGRRLAPLECHDILCAIGEVVVVGGVRRSALISLSDLDDEAMRGAKAGEWWAAAPQRYIANNSAVYDATPPRAAFDAEWAALAASGSGERGIFSRAASAEQCTASRGRAAAGVPFGTNPCSEIILRPHQFCNLTEVVVRASDSVDEIERKVRMATTLGTWQATLTRWKESAGGVTGGLRPVWRANTEAERLLGVSLTGIMDNELTAGRRGSDALRGALTRLRRAAVATNAAAAAALGIGPAAAITCVKPSGTVSQLVDAASGIHPRHSHFYFRRVRGANTDPLTRFLAASGVPHEPCVYSKASTVFTFPIAAPAGAVVRDDLDAVSHLELCLAYQRHWCEHKASVTITVRDGEWRAVGDWVYSHFDELAGASFLPHDMGTYKQTPYEAVPEPVFRAAAAAMPAALDWAAFRAVERGSRDALVGRDLACSSGECEAVGEEVPGERRRAALDGASGGVGSGAAAGAHSGEQGRAAAF